MSSNFSKVDDVHDEDSYIWFKTVVLKSVCSRGINHN